MAFKKPTPTRADYEKYQKHTEDLLRDERTSYQDAMRAARIQRNDKEAGKRLEDDAAGVEGVYSSGGRYDKEKSALYGSDSEDAINYDRVRRQIYGKGGQYDRDKAEIKKLKEVDEKRMRDAGMKKGGKVKMKSGGKVRGNGCCKRTKKCKMY
jgi:hypothetical protein